MSDTPNNDAAGRDAEGIGDLDAFIQEMSSAEVPAEVRAMDEGNEEARGRASHAFAEMKRKAKVAAEAAKKAQQENEELRRTQQASTPVPSQPVVDPTERIMSGKLSAYEVLTDTDRMEVTKRLSKLSLDQQVDDGVIHAVVCQYVGEKHMSGAGSTASGNGSGEEASAGAGADEEEAHDREAAAAAAASARSGTRRVVTVKPGAGAPPAPVRLTPEQTAEMRRLGLTDVKAYLAAKQRVADYRGR